MAPPRHLKTRLPNFHNRDMGPAAYAFSEEHSRGRRFREPAHPYRGEFQRDRDRIIHSRAFRRLENKTQVFTARYSDHFRNRLTHTLEVAQISRTAAHVLALNSELVETLALVHDIGHPPFGHSGERVLDELMKQYGDRFDHNLHALRIVEELENRYSDFAGLNLTFEVREGIIKHSRDYAPDEHPELSEYLLDLRPPLEAQLIDLTDEISYCTADLDDACEAHLLDLAEICRGVPLVARLLAQIDDEHRHASEKLRFYEAVRRLIDYFVTDMIATTGAAASSLTSSEAVRRWPGRLAGFSRPVKQELQQLKAFLYQRLYHNERLSPEKRRAEQIVRDVFTTYLEQPNRLPLSQQERTASIPLHRVICDYVAGMTDSYVTAMWQELAPRKRAALGEVR